MSASRARTSVRRSARSDLVLLATMILCACTPARLYAQCPDGSPPPCARPASRPPARAAAPAPAANSVAVMLFTNVTGDTADAYLSMGLASEIATGLAQVPRLEVSSPGAVRSAMRGIEPDPRLVGRRLNVHYVVEGDFQRGGDRIRISVRLVAVPSGTQRWSDAYTRPASDLLAVQEEIASAVATAIAGRLLPQERTVLAARPTRDPEAYDHYLRGNAQLAKRSPAGLASAITEYTAAVARDPGFARAHARIALCYALYVIWGWDLPGLSPDSEVALGFGAADRALALDSSVADGWMARGYLLAERYPRTLEGSLDALERATVLDPRNPEAWHQYGTWLTFSGREEEGLAAFRRALALEPARAVTWWMVGDYLYGPLRRSAAVLQAFDSALVADPEFFIAYAFRSLKRLASGDTPGARADANAAMRYSPASEAYYGLAPLAAVAAAGGDTAQARRLLDEATALFTRRTPNAVAAEVICGAMLAVGETDRALAFLQRVEPRGALLYTILQLPAFDAARTDPRFARLVEEARPPWAR